MLEEPLADHGGFADDIVGWAVVITRVVVVDIENIAARVFMYPVWEEVHLFLKKYYVFKLV